MLTRICMYCDIPMGEKEGGDGVTHGICDGCYAEKMEEVNAMEPQTPQTPMASRVYNREGTEYGIFTGGGRHCQMEGCAGRRQGVRWPDGLITWPCDEGVALESDGAWHILPHDSRLAL